MHTKHRCPLPVDDACFVRYHDEEWGRPTGDDNRLYEKVCLEGFQAGLSWSTILNKRDAFRDCFAGFDIDAVAGFGEKTVERLACDARIVRNRRKIESAIHNASRARELRDEFGSLARFFWSFEPPSDERPAVVTPRLAAHEPDDLCVNATRAGTQEQRLEICRTDQHVRPDAGSRAGQ